MSVSAKQLQDFTAKYGPYLKWQQQGTRQWFNRQSKRLFKRPKQIIQKHDYEIAMLKRRIKQNKPERMVYKLNQTATGTTIDNSGTVITHWSPIQQGDDIDDRTGDSITAKYISLKWYLYQHASASHTQVRLVLVRINESAAPTP